MRMSINPAKTALRLHSKTGKLSDFIRICADIGPAYVQGVALAPALTQSLRNLKGLQGKGGKGGGTCFCCGRVGCFAREFPIRSLAEGQGGHPTPLGSEVAKSRVPGICPR